MSGILQHAAQGGNLNREVVVLDHQPCPGCVDQDFLGDRSARAFQQHPKQRNRTLAERGRFGASEQDAGVGVEAERPESMDRRHWPP